jgi:hypothetical protein
MCLIVSAAYLPWYSNLLYDFNREPIIIQREAPASIARIIFDIFRITFSDFHFTWNPILTVLYIPLIIIGLLRLKSKFLQHSDYLPIYLILIFFIPFIFLYFILSTDRARYYAPFMFPLLILLALGIQNLSIKGVAGKLFVLSLAVFIISNNVMDFADFFNWPCDENWKEAARLIKQTTGYHSNSNVFIFQTKYNPPVFAYYFWGPEKAVHFIDNISTEETYEKDIQATGIKEKIYFIKDMKGKQFFDKLSSLPDSSWVWILRYHDRFFSNDFRVENKNRYFFHKIPLNKELEPIDLYLLKRIVKRY